MHSIDINKQINNGIVMNSIISEKKELYAKLPIMQDRLQEHEETRMKQMGYWAQMIQSYCKDKNIISTSLQEIHDFPIMQSPNADLPKKLLKKDLHTILKELEKNGKLQFHSDKILILHFSLEQMAQDMYRWAKQKYLINDVQTLYFIAEGDKTTIKQKFAKQPIQIIIKIVQVLQQQGRAALISNNGEYSAKFF